MPSQQVIDKLLETQKELDKIKTAVKHIEDASDVAQKAAHVVLEMQKLVKELDSIEKEYRLELLKLLREQIGEIERRIESAVKELEIGITELRQLAVDLSRLEKSTSNYFEEIKKIDFPKRLDKIDNQISSINIGIQNLQGDVKRVQDKVEAGFKVIEHQLTGGFSSVSSNIDTKVSEAVNLLEHENELLRKEIKTNRIIQIVAAVVVVALLAYLASKH